MEDLRWSFQHSIRNTYLVSQDVFNQYQINHHHGERAVDTETLKTRCDPTTLLDHTNVGNYMVLQPRYSLYRRWFYAKGLTNGFFVTLTFFFFKGSFFRVRKFRLKCLSFVGLGLRTNSRVWWIYSVEIDNSCH